MRKSVKKTTDAATATDPTPICSEGSHTPRAAPSFSRDWEPSSWPFRPEDISPLSWWRTMPADLLRDSEHLLLRETISKIGVLKGREWVTAMRGDVAAGVQIAMAVLPINEITLEVDLAMTALMLNALDGNAGAAVVLSCVLGRTSLDHPFGKELSVSWLVLNLRRAIATRKQPVKTGCRADRAVARGAGRSGASA